MFCDLYCVVEAVMVCVVLLSATFYVRDEVSHTIVYDV